jgi:hypothetical protein
LALLTARHTVLRLSAGLYYQGKQHEVKEVLGIGRVQKVAKNQKALDFSRAFVAVCQVWER